MLIFPNAPALWSQCNRCSNLGKCTDPFPTSGACPHLDQLRIQFQHPCRPTESHLYYFSAIAQEPELARIFARWQVSQPTDDKDFVAIRDYHLAHPDDGVATHLVYDFLAFPLNRLREKCRLYYQRTQQEIDDAFSQALFLALIILTPRDVAACSARGGHWTLAFIDAMQFAMRLHLKERTIDLNDQDDDAFREIFEREWRILKDYLDYRFNFLVIPRLSYQHMARYQELPSGNAIIRQAVSTYLIHQCFFYPHFGANWMPSLPYEAMWSLIRRCYEPLIGKTVARAARNLRLGRDKVGATAKNALRVEVERAFDEFGAQFDFFLNAPEGFKGRGILGLNEDKEAQVEIDRILEKLGFTQRSTDINATPFAHYIKENLDHWVTKHYPQIQDFSTRHTNTVAGADGQVYLTVNGAQQRFGVSVDQLRYLDRIGALEAIRLRDVAPTDPPLSPDTRLYADNEQTRRDINIASLRATTHSSALSGKQLNRKQAAISLNVTIGILRELEKIGLLTPTKMGHIVVYTEADLIAAQTVIEQRKQQKTTQALK